MNDHMNGVPLFRTGILSAQPAELRTVVGSCVNRLGEAKMKNLLAYTSSFDPTFIMAAEGHFGP